ncbi:MAG TPA: RNA polymerase sigma factor, partial [Povalibacter sp.]
MPEDLQQVAEGVQEARQRFLALVGDVRPDLHRYCARMTGSVVDGEDVVQDTLARAYFELPELKELPSLRSWLFRIAHNRALDLIGRYERRMGTSMEAVEEEGMTDSGTDPADVIARQQAVDAAVSRFVELSPLQRSCVILKDVLDHSLEEIAGLLGLSLTATKAALHRGRTRLTQLATEPQGDPGDRVISAAMCRYAQLFNARDWDGVRAMLVEDVRLDVVGVTRRTGRGNVGIYFSNYDRLPDWRVLPGWVDDREVLLVLRRGEELPAYFIALQFAGDQVEDIRDFFHV